ncbi:MAG: hypothetical protein PHQ03_07620 [Methylococcales bacterium]|nr:hypothetical protein [Methylococcales bacterium]
MKPLTLTQASQTCKKAKATLLDAIKSGRLSAKKNDKDVWEIDPAELHRVYPYQLENATKNANLPHEKPKPTPELIEVLEKERAREREQMQATIDDLRKRLDEEAEERRKLTKLLAHQTEQPPQKKENALFKRIFKNR